MDDRRTKRERAADAEALLAIEGNPLTEAEKRMFARWERQGLSDEEQLKRIRARFDNKADPIA